MRNLCCFCLFLIFLSGCKPGEVGSEKGSIFVNVKDSYGRSVSGAIISAEPAIPEAKTDNLGSVLIKNVNVGTYEVIATKDQYGSGKTATVVKGDDIANITIFLEYGKYASFAPSAKIEFPVLPANYSTGEEILFKGYVSDNDTPAGEIDVRWESNIDGVLNTAKPDKDGMISFSSSRLSRNKHVIRLIAKDKSGNIGRDSIIVSTMSPKSLSLAEPRKSNTEIVLNWSKSDDPDFKEYRLYRMNQSCEDNSKVLIATIQNANTITYTDNRPPFATKVCYAVDVVTNSLLSRRSNSQQVDYPSGYFLDFTPTEAVIHPSKPWLFLCNRDKNKIVVFDYTESKIVTEIAVPSPSGYILVGNNGNGTNLYVPGGTNSVFIYSADDFNLKKTLTTEASAADVAISETGIVFVTVRNQWTNPISSFDEKTGLIISAGGSCIYGGGRLRKIPGQNTLMTISTGISPVDMDLLFYDAKGNFTGCKDDMQHGDYALDPSIFRVAPKGDYVLTSSLGAAYLSDNSMKYLGQISRGELTFSDFAFNADGSIFYASTTNRQSVQIGKYPELTRYNEILTRGYPIKLFVRGNQLVTLSRTSQYEASTAVELLTIP